GPRAAAVLGTQEVFFAVVATTAVLVAVFVPLSFLPGQAGGLFKEFGFVLAFSVFLSSIVALTLCPMLASRFLKEGMHESGPSGLPGLAGGLFEAFGFVPAFTVHMASIVAVPLCATLASGFLKGGMHESGPTGSLARFGVFATTLSKRCLQFCLNAPLIVVLI